AEAAAAANGLSVAVYNGVDSVVLSGEVAALDKLQKELTDKGTFCARPKVDVAAHSHQMEALQPALGEALKDLKPQPGTSPVFSTVTGELLDVEHDAAYWCRNLREPVQFSRVIDALSAAGYNTFLEISPHPVLVPGLKTTLAQGSVAIGTLRREQPERHTLLLN